MLHFDRVEKDEFDGFINFFTKKKVKINKYFSAEGSHHPIWGKPFTTLNYSIESNEQREQWASEIDEAKNKNR